jgi:precorrin-6B methylase 2
MTRMRTRPSRRARIAIVFVAASLCVTPAFGQAAPGTTEADREQWQKVPEIFAAMGVTAGSRVADVGAGSGFFTVRLARAVGAGGRVYAVDVSPDAVRDLKARIAREELGNVEVIAGDAADPRLPESLDAVLIVNAYHEMREYRAILDKIRRALKLEGRLVIVEPIALNRRHTSRAEQQSNHEIAVEFAADDLRLAGFEIVERRDRFVENLLDRDTEWLLVARPSY